jgi:hypothetical protein
MEGVMKECGCCGQEFEQSVIADTVINDALCPTCSSGTPLDFGEYCKAKREVLSRATQGDVDGQPVGQLGGVTDGESITAS